MTTLNLIVGAGADDGYNQLGSTNVNNSSTLAFGNTSSAIFRSFARFTNVTIPNGATINSCVATFNASANRPETTCNAILYFENADNPSAPINGADFNGRALTAGTAWNNVPAWTINTDYNTPDFAAELQSVVNRGGFASGNAIQCLIFDNSSSTNARRTPKGYDNSTTLCPRLAVDYTEAADESSESSTASSDSSSPSSDSSSLSSQSDESSESSSSPVVYNEICPWLWEVMW